MWVATALFMSRDAWGMDILPLFCLQYQVDNVTRRLEGQPFGSEVIPLSHVHGGPMSRQAVHPKEFGCRCLQAIRLVARCRTIFAEDAMQAIRSRVRWETQTLLEKGFNVVVRVSHGGACLSVPVQFISDSTVLQGRVHPIEGRDFANLK